MIKKFFRLTIRNRAKCTNLIWYASIYNRPKIEFQKSFTYWILQHFRNNPKYITHRITEKMKHDLLKNDIIKSTLLDEKNISSLNTDDLLSYVLIISPNIIDVINVVKSVDGEFCKRLDENDIIEDYPKILKITDTLIHFTHNRTHLVKSYMLCIENIKKIIKTKEIMPEHLIQCVFYTSVLKRNQLAMSTLKLIFSKIHFQTKIIDVLTPTELAIFCNSVYKSSTKILSKRILTALVNVVDKQADTLFATEKLSISILKPLYQAKYHDYQFLKMLSDKIVNRENVDLNSYSFTSTVYLVKLFSNALYSDEKFFIFLADDVMRKLIHMYENREYIRAKDISILLKAFCELGFDSLKQCSLKNILPILNEAYDNFHIKEYELQCFADIILWLSILGVCNAAFLDKVVDSKLIIKGKHHRSSKSLCKMNLLLTILSVEKLLKPEKIDALIKLVEPTEGHSMEQLFKSQPALYDTYQASRCLASANNDFIKETKIEFQIPNLFIPGITVQTKRSKISIEIFDRKSCLHGTFVPHGYMKLKLRLLKKAGYEVLIVTEDTVKEGSEHLIVMIEDNIRKIEEMSLVD